jgi:hypothetical protein
MATELLNYGCISKVMQHSMEHESTDASNIVDHKFLVDVLSSSLNIQSEVKQNFNKKMILIPSKLNAPSFIQSNSL